ncbi:CILIATE-C4 protein kinase [Aphanomyces astaci]|uniref:CILIATE-C4 protein kinase n=2 Tax=Aphanomyces astaci TaxID=112090 RepID=W4FRL4_APHAT|nr:CILIATE-C4 protein kinase [Aphanomyces astaci]ETV70107.1 CILIATE-C4 protein kinase [Aphanomyces astaci]|eukprot:XP_009840550.1 CILIATE-C4 protein kinase [Aphanomyces astaci]
MDTVNGGGKSRPVVRGGSGGRVKLRPVPVSSLSTNRPKTPPTTKSSTAASILLAKAQATAAADDRQLGGYTKLKKLGVGGCGTVWQVATTETATSPERDLFALKQIPKGDGAVVSGVVEARVGLKLFPTAAVVRDKLLQGLRHHDVATPPLAATVSLSQLNATIVDGNINKEQTIILDYRPDENPPLAPSPPPSAPVNIPMYIVPLLAVVETKQDLWLVFEQGGETLHNALFDIRGEFLHGSRSYRICHRPLYEAMRDNVCLLKSLLRQLLLAVQTLGAHHIVHADIKPDNILVRHSYSTPPTLPPHDDNYSSRPPSSHHIDPQVGRVTVQLIDFGSAFTSTSPRLPSAHTPEYVPPDILELLRTKHQTNHVKAYLDAHSRPHSFDMWSLGCVFLEIACGVPLWLPFKARVDSKYRDDKKPLVTGGLLAATGRNADKIATRQLHVVANLRKCIRECGGMNVDSRRWVHGVDLMQRMLEIDPAQRISPTQALAHPFLASGTVVSPPPHGLTTGQGQNAPHPVNTDVATFSLR